MLKRRVTMVATPRKWPGREAPSRRVAMGPGSTKVVLPAGYMAAAEGAKRRWTPADSNLRQSSSKGRGEDSKSSSGPNWVGLTKMETATASFWLRAVETRERWPKWSAPMVGTRPRVRACMGIAARGARQGAGLLAGGGQMRR